MLTLERYLRQSIIITLEDNRRIEIKLIKLMSGGAIIGVEAARTIQVDRKEIRRRKDAEEGLDHGEEKNHVETLVRDSGC